MKKLLLITIAVISLAGAKALSAATETAGKPTTGEPAKHHKHEHKHEHKHHHHHHPKNEKQSTTAFGSGPGGTTSSHPFSVGD